MTTLSHAPGRAETRGMERALRILLLNSQSGPVGGAERHVSDVAELLAGTGHTVESWAPAPTSGLRALRDRVRNPAVRAHVAERIAAFRPDVVHVHNFMRRLSPEPFVQAWRAGVATLLTVHDFQLFCPRSWALRHDGSPCSRPSLPLCMFGNCRGGLDGVAGRAIYALNTLRVRRAAAIVRQRATLIAAPSRSLADRLTATLRRDVVHLPHPFPAPALLEPPRSRDLLFLGRVAREKGLDRLLRALAAVPDLRLTVAGNGPELETCRQLAGTLQLGGRVRFLGWVAESGLPELLSRHGALVLPSLWMENSPLAVHEALAAGRPVLGSRRGGVPELVEHGRQGLVFEPLDEGSVGAALRSYAAWSEAEHLAMAARARERAASFGPGAFLQRLVQLYREAVAKCRLASGH